MPKESAADLDRQLGERIGRALEQAGKSQTWLAKQLGKSKSLISQHVRGERRCPVGRVYQIARLLGVPADTLLPADLPVNPREQRALEILERVPEELQDQWLSMWDQQVDLSFPTPPGRPGKPSE